MKYLMFFVFGALVPSAQAQLYVAQDSGNVVGEYNITNGAAINAKLISAGVNGPAGIALSGDYLFVANSGINTVGKYDAKTGQAINAKFISKGLSTPLGIAVSGNNLFVANSNGNLAVGEYDATTGEAIDATFIPYAGQLGNPSALAISSDGSTLFVAHYEQFVGSNFGFGSVGAYNTATGAPFNATLIIGLAGPCALAVSGNTLYVANSDYSFNFKATVGTYDATTGAAINANFITGLSSPYGLGISGDTLFVASRYGLGTVGAYNASTGAVINANFIIEGPTTHTPYGLAVSTAEPDRENP